MENLCLWSSSVCEYKETTDFLFWSNRKQYSNSYKEENPKAADINLMTKKIIRLFFVVGMEHMKITVHSILTEKTKINLKKKEYVWDLLKNTTDRELMQGHESHLYWSFKSNRIHQSASMHLESIS